MRFLIAFVGLLSLFHNLVFADVSVRVSDTNGAPIPDAVVSINISGHQKTVLQHDSATQPAAIMDQINKAFSPQVLVVSKAQQVVFPNSDQVRHHVYSFSKPNDFEIRLYSGDQAEPVAFNHAGIVVLGCNIHDQMVGYIYVADEELALVTNEQGIVSFKEDLFETSSDQTITLWHSRLSSSKLERITRNISVTNANEIIDVSLELLPELPKSSRKFKPGYK